VLVSALTNEPKSAQVQHWLESHDETGLLISDWVATEFSSAMSLKLRAGHVDEARRAEALTLFTRIIASTFEVLRVERSHFRIASDFANRHELGLRGGDALHLALCKDHGAGLCTHDKRMHLAAVAFGIRSVFL